MIKEQNEFNEYLTHRTKRMVGDVLTILEVLGMSEPQAKAVKDIVKREMWDHHEDVWHFFWNTVVCGLKDPEIGRLAEFLMKYYPDTLGEGDPIHGESAVDVAIRLLSEKAGIESFEPSSIKNPDIGNQ